MTTPFSHDRITVDQLDRYLRGESAPDEHAVVGAWVLAHPEAKAFVERVTREAAAEDLDGAWAAVVGRVWGEETRGVERATVHSGVHGQVLGKGILLGSTLALTAIAFLVQWTRNASSAASQSVQYATGHGQRHVTLPDGSNVVLAPHSRLRYVADGHGPRTVTLSGQAYFTVTHDVQCPFTVHAGTVQTQVLGTAFDVKHYANDAAVQITVVDGKVAARNRDGRGVPVFLIAGTEGTLTDSTAVIVTSQNVENAVAWRDGRLVFDDTPVPVMLRTLEQWYGYQFRLTDTTLSQRQVTARFSIGDTVNTLVKLKALLEVTLHFNGSVVTLSPVQHSSKKKSPSVRPDSNAFSSFLEVGK